MSELKEQLPECFSDIDTVFPIMENGLRTSPQKCMECEHKTLCLREAIQKGKKGASVQEEFVDRAYKSGTIGFWARWSRKKALNRVAQKKLQSKKRY
ncbi:hypothetical protein MHK_010720 [Candidatus Magnetomorum sp. HK-1]|nr:hypothetical protein MHK_010720 [Candidatus Magnetomorum sp. HK-1]